MPIFALGPKKPSIDRSAVLAPSSTIIGDVAVGPRTSVWPGAVIRGDYGYIRIGSDCSVQDNVVIHCSAENPTIIGNGVTIAHNAVVHACRIGDECLVGVGAIIFDGARVGSHSILGVGSTVLSGMSVPSRSVVVGSPAKVLRKASRKDIDMIRESFKTYTKMARRYSKLRVFQKPVG